MVSVVSRPYSQGYVSEQREAKPVALFQETHYTDLYNATRLVDRYGDRLRYAHGTGWLVYDGTQWKQDKTMQVFRDALAVVKGYYLEANDMDGRDGRELEDFARRSESIISLRHMVETATLDERTACTMSAFDTDDTLYLLNTRNKTIDLKTSEARGHSSDDMITRCANVEYVNVTPERMANSRWLRFIDEIACGDKELAFYLQRCLGYSISGDTSEQALFICYGSGGNGKSLLFEVVRTVLGEYATTIPIEALLSNRSDGISNEIAELPGMRFVTSSESDSGRRLQTGLIKRLTGDETIRARRLYENSTEFKPQAHLWISTNHKPEIPDDSNGMWRRLKLIPFNASFPKPDTHLKQTLLSESDIVLQWLIEGYCLWQSEGLGEPQIVKDAVDSYRLEQDPLHEFFQEKCILSPDKATTFSELYSAYSFYAGYGAMSKKALGQMLAERGFPKRNSGGLKVMGIGLIDPYR